MPQPASSPRRSRSLLAGFLALLIAAVPTVVAAPSASAMSKGLMDENLPRSNDAIMRDEFFDTANAAGVSYVRTYLQWEGHTTAPDPGEVARVRRYATEAVARGIRTMFIGFNGQIAAPQGGNITDGRNVSLTKYRALVRNSVLALKDLPIRLYWEPINEANIYTLFPKKNGPELWRKMQNVAYDEIKSITPNAPVLSGELAPYARNPRSTNPGTWVSRALGLDSNFNPKKGTRAKDYAIKSDGWTLHSYDYKVDPNRRLNSNAKWTIRNLAHTRSLLRKMARLKRISSAAARSVYGTEFAYIAEGSQAVSEEKAALWTRRAWNIAKRNGLRSFLWFQVRDPTDVFYSGLKTVDGAERKVYKVFLGLK